MENKKVDYEKVKYADMLDLALSIPEAVDWEQQRIYKLSQKFKEGEIKTLGVENLFPLYLAAEGKLDQIAKYLRLKTCFKFLETYAHEALRFPKNAERLKKVQERSNEPRTIRLYTFLRNLSLVEAYTSKTWLSAKNSAIAGHASRSSIGTLGDVLWSENFIQKRQDPKDRPTRGSISYSLTSRGARTIGLVDAKAKRIDKEVWQDYLQFLSQRGELLKDVGFKTEVKSKVEYFVDHHVKTIEDRIIYTGAGVEPSREFIGKTGEKILMLKKF